MNNTKKTTTLAVAAIFIAAALVVGGALAATTSATQSALAYSNKKKGGDENSNNGNTVTIQKCKQAAIQSGWDNDQEQECENLICTHPGENATCVQEGVVTTTTPIPTPTPTPTTIRVTGQGEGTSTCPLGGPLDASIAFNVVQQPGSAVQGNFEITVSTGLVKSGTLDSVQITGNSFTIRGTEDTQTGPVCKFSQLPSSATITGQCGTGVTIDFATADGETARFTNANVQCTTTF
jgi:hypothetical protein